MTTFSAAAMPRGADRAAADRAIAFWLIGCAAMIFLMVMIGGITRLTESGLSITEWQPIVGVLPPLSAAQWHDAFVQYQAIPQFHAIHADMTLAQFKGIYFWEYLHRLWGRLIGLVFLLPFLYFLLRGRIGRTLWPKLALIFVLGALQGALGWYMVESGLEHRIEVSQYRLAAHLFTAIVIYGAILWVAFDLLRQPGSNDRSTRQVVRWGLNLVLLLVAVTLIAGAFVAGLRGGSIYNTFPMMGDRFMPGEYGALSPLWRNWFENPASAQFDHRVLAETTWLVIVLLWAFGRSGATDAARRALDLLAAMATIQAGLGIATLLSVVALPIAVSHQAGAVLLVTAALYARHSAMGRARAELDRVQTFDVTPAKGGHRRASARPKNLVARGRSPDGFPRSRE
jgi:cytochrome c oxidase assembly protein subunit 15